MDCWLPDFNRSLREYYHPDTLREILAAREWFQARHPWNRTDAFLLACAMHVLHGNRPYALSRRSHPVTPFAPTGALEYRAFSDRLSRKMNRVLEAPLPNTFAAGRVFEHDATSWWHTEIQELDAVITSPPFFASTRFFLANWISIWFAGWGQFDFQSGKNQFLEERQKRTFDWYDSILRQSRERLKPGGVLLMHLGKSKKCDMGNQLALKAKKWFRRQELFAESVEHCESHGIRDKGTVTTHQYLLLY